MTASGTTNATMATPHQADAAYRQQAEARSEASPRPTPQSTSQNRSVEDATAAPSSSAAGQTTTVAPAQVASRTEPAPAGAVSRSGHAVNTMA